MEYLISPEAADRKKGQGSCIVALKSRGVPMEVQENGTEVKNYKLEIIQGAKAWIQDLKAARDELNFISVKNAILLDNLVMAGGFSEF